MNLRTTALALAVAALVLVVIVTSGSSATPWTLHFTLADADGLREGAPVAIAGQDVGNIDLAVKNGRVAVTLKIDHQYGPVGRNVSASIDSVNLLGQKRIELAKGNLKDPAPATFTMPNSHVTVSADLDQVLDVLTPDVRARLDIVLNEAGLATTGREKDIASTLQQFPADFSELSALVQAVANNNNTLGGLVQNSDGFVRELNHQHSQLVDVIDTLGQSSATLAQKKAQLTATLASAPGALSTLDTFLGKLRTLSGPLGPAADDITHTAPQLQNALAQIPAFTQAANPVLTQATSDAPELTSLANGATPVLKQATPVLSQVAALGTSLQPVSATLNKSADNLLAILQNWSRAIQLRDGLSHVFRGEASISPYTLTSLISQLDANPVGGSSLAKLEKSLLGAGSTGAATPKTPAKRTSGKSITHAPTQTSAASPAGTATSPAGTAATGATTSSAPASPAANVGQNLNSLLGYLLK